MEVKVILDKGEAVITLTPEQLKEIGRQQDPYLQACIKMGKTPRPELANNADSETLYWDACYRLEECIEAKNAIAHEDGGFKKWEKKYDGTERHYFPIHKHRGSGRACFTYDSWSANATVGPRREYRTYELMMEGVKEFDQYYQIINNFL